jgi:hypothetical protein
MVTKKTLVSFILDETGSMGVVKSQTISGFNEYIETLKKDENSKNILFTLTKFNSSKIEVVSDGVKLNDVITLNDDNYVPNHMTPLYDAIAKTIRSLEKKVKGKKQAVLVVIQTDGEENSSLEFKREGIFKLIDEKKNLGWTFAFLGADQDAWLASQKLGILAGNTMSYASVDTTRTLRGMATATIAYASTGGEQTENYFTDGALLNNDTFGNTDKTFKTKKQ